MNLGLKQFIDNFFTLLLFNIFIIIIIKLINWDIIVAIAIPLTPIAGINKKPNINNGLSKIFKKKLSISKFL